MNKTEIIRELAKKHKKSKKEMTLIINDFLLEIEASLLEGDRVTLSDFGTFNVSERRGFDGVDPRTGNKLSIPKRRIAIFRSGKRLKRKLND